MTEPRSIKIPIPSPSQVVLAVSDGIRFAAVAVDRHDLETSSASSIRSFLAKADEGIDLLARSGKGEPEPEPEPEPEVIYQGATWEQIMKIFTQTN